jgi:hypothetical protein
LVHGELEIVLIDDHQATQNMTRGIMKGETVADFANRITGKDGQVLTINWSAKWNAEESIFFVIARDTTERKENWKCNWRMKS